MVFQLVGGHQPLPERVPGVEAGMRGHALQSPTAAGGGGGGDPAFSEHRVVDELPLIPGNVAPFALVDFLVL